MTTAKKYREALERIAQGSPDPVAVAIEALAAARKKQSPLNLTGRIFGRWTVLGRGARITDTADRKHTAQTWNCRCECGTERQLKTSRLTRGTSKSCGCLSAEMASTRMRRRHRVGYRDEDEL